VAGAFLMGSVSGFLAAPCTGPVLTGLLAFVAKSQSTPLGAGLLFIYALGIGAPFFVLGVGAFRLPRGGVWMEWVKGALGVVLVALAASYLKDGFRPLREAMASFGAQLGAGPGAILAAVLAASGILLGAVHRTFKAARGEAVARAFGVVLVAGALLVRGAALNAPAAGQLWVKLGWAEAPQSELTWHLKYDGTRPMDVFDVALTRARAEGRPVMIDFFAEWCAACKELDREVYVAPEVVSAAGRFITIKIDGTNEQDAINALYERFGVQGLPTVAFVTSTGDILPEPRVTGYLAPEKFLALLEKVP
jgi:thioredoxin:protein disulfide reductase